MHTEDSMASAERAGRRAWLGLAVLALPTLLLALDMSVLYLALPHLAADLAPSSSQLLWITDIYGFMIAGFLITMGNLGDRIGRRRLLMIGAAAFGVASVFAAYSTSAEMLIATRTLLGVAGATLMPSTLALISNMFRNPGQRALAISVWMSCFMGGTAVGPVIGGLVLQSFWWGSVFLIGVPVMVVLLIAAPLLLPEYRDPNAGRIDLGSVALSLATILPVIYGLKELAKAESVTGPVVAVMIGAGFGVVFVRRQLRSTDPLVDIRLFANRTFSTALVVMLVGAMAMGGMFLYIAQYLQLVGDRTPLGAGLWMVPPTIVMIGGTLIAPRVAERIGRGNLIGGGMVLTAGGMALLSQVTLTSGPLPVVTGMAICAVGLCPGAALVTDIVVGSVPPERAGSAASMSETSGEFGIATGIALLGSLGTFIYRGRVSGPEGLPADATAEAGDTLAGAAAVADGLPDGLAAPLLASARDAFTTGLNTVAVIGGVVVALFGILAIRLLRRGPEDRAGSPEQDTSDVDEVSEPEPCPVAGS